MAADNDHFIYHLIFRLFCTLIRFGCIFKMISNRLIDDGFFDRLLPLNDASLAVHRTSKDLLQTICICIEDDGSFHCTVLWVKTFNTGGRGRPATYLPTVMAFTKRSRTLRQDVQSQIKELTQTLNSETVRQCDSVWKAEEQLLTIPATRWWFIV